MNAIRQTVEVKNHTINIELPKDFDAELVDVIILPKESEDYFYISEEEKELMRQRLKNSRPDDAKPWSELRKKYIKDV